VAPLLPRPGHLLLRCPICRLGLYPRAGTLACPNRHAFDLARDGYVNLLPANRRRPAGGGDLPEQLRHRAAFLEAGHFDFIAAAILARFPQTGTMSAGGPQHILDAGCGTGHHLARIAAALGRGARARHFACGGPPRRAPVARHCVRGCRSVGRLAGARCLGRLRRQHLRAEKFCRDGARAAIRRLAGSHISRRKSSRRTPASLPTDGSTRGQGEALRRGRQPDHRAAGGHANYPPHGPRRRCRKRCGSDGAECPPPGPGRARCQNGTGHSHLRCHFAARSQAGRSTGAKFCTPS
jgi:hypothetical protein